MIRLSRYFQTLPDQLPFEARRPPAAQQLIYFTTVIPVVGDQTVSGALRWLLPYGTENEMGQFGLFYRP